MRRQLALAVMLTLASLLILADGCRSQLPTQFSRMQDEPMFAPSEPRPGGDPMDWYDSLDPDYQVDASYDRVDKLLTITVESIYESDSHIEIADIPEWIEIPTGTEYTIEGGSGTTGVFVQLFASEENEVRLKISAADAENLHSDVAYTTVRRPLYFYRAEYDPSATALYVDLSASDRQSGYIECQLPAGVSTTADTRIEFTGRHDFIVPLSIESEDFTGGQAYFTASDQFGNTAEIAASIFVWPPSLEPDTLYAYPLSSEATTAEYVTIVVATGLPANPFQYMNGVGVTVENGATYVDGTYNVGAPGGEQRFPDGIWGTMDPVPTDFLLPFDFMIQENDIGEGRVRIDFNVTPLFDGPLFMESRATDGGELFNFQLEFSTGGTYKLGFEEFHDVQRTYFSDADSKEHLWGDISNSHPNVPNSIIVR